MYTHTSIHTYVSDRDRDLSSVLHSYVKVPNVPTEVINLKMNGLTHNLDFYGILRK